MTVVTVFLYWKVTGFKKKIIITWAVDLCQSETVFSAIYLYSSLMLFTLIRYKQICLFLLSSYFCECIFLSMWCLWKLQLLLLQYQFYGTKCCFTTTSCWCGLSWRHSGCLQGRSHQVRFGGDDAPKNFFCTCPPISAFWGDLMTYHCTGQKTFKTNQWNNSPQKLTSH